MLALDIFYVHTKFCKTHFGDMIGRVKIQNGLSDPDHTLFRGGLSSVS